MNLKEAFRFQNKLGALMDEAQSILSLESNITKVENTFLRRKVFEGAENETVVDTPPTEFADRITELVSFLVYLMAQREALCKAIHAAKNSLPIDMDSEVGLNAKRQEHASHVSKFGTRAWKNRYSAREIKEIKAYIKEKNTYRSPLENHREEG